MANIGIVVAFRSGNPKDEQLIQPLFDPFVVEGELSNLPAYNFYTRISAIQAQEPLSGETVVLDIEGNNEVARKAKEISRRLYGRISSIPELEVGGQENFVRLRKKRTKNTKKKTAGIQPIQ